MDNNEIDKILKQKLSSTLEPPKELEEKIKEHIKNQKDVFKQSNSYNKNEVKIKAKNKTRLLMNMSKIISIAAVFILVFVFGIFYKNQEGQPLIQFIPGTNENNKQTVTIKTIQPTKLNSGIIEKDTEFIIQVEEEGTTVENVQKSLYVEPALDYEITKTGSNEYKLKFKQNIPNNTILKLQYVKNQITENSWAYQTSTDLSVNNTFPWDGRTNVSENSTIEIELSYANVQNFEENVTISPNVVGKWEHLGKIWKFTPERKLDYGTYTVVVNKNIVAESKNLKEDYKFEFSVGANDNSYNYFHDNLSVDGIETFSENEQVRIYYYAYANGGANYIPQIAKMEIRQFANTNDFINYLKNKNYDKATNFGNYEFEIYKTENDKFVALKQSLKTGYYVAIAIGENGKELFNAPVQINNTQSYVIETQRDIMAWVAENGQLASNVEVNYLGKTAKTDGNGIAKLEGITDGASEIKYVTIGNNDNKLVVGVNNFTHENYPNAFLYTDRPLYKSTDTINIWGFVPKNFFYDEIDENEFYIGHDYNGKDKKKIKVDEEGNVNFKIELNNNVDEYMPIYLFYKNERIGYTSVQIMNYELQNYNYEVIADKDYAYDGENFEFDIKVTHITGIPVPGKTVTIQYKEEPFRVKTDEKGIAHVSVKAEYGNYLIYYNGISYSSIYIYNGDIQEYTDALETIQIKVLARDVYIDLTKNDEKYNGTIYQLEKEKVQKIDDIKDLYDGTYDTDVDIYLSETKHTRYISGYEYNEYTKENSPIYRWTSTEGTNKLTTLKTENGKFTFDANTLSLKENTDEVWYDYSLTFEIKDRSGKTLQVFGYIYRNNVYENSGAGYWDYFSGFNSRYSMYRYYISDEDNYEKKYLEGDIVKLKLIDSFAGDTEIKNEGKILRIIIQKDIQKTDIIEDNNLNYTFTKEDYPGINITFAYFLNGKFYRTPSRYFDFDETDRKVDVEIEADKEKYKPGETVNLTIKTTNKGNPIKTSVNISVANEAVFKIVPEDEKDLLTYIYMSNNNPVYTYSSYLDFIDKYAGGGGGGGGDGKVRSNFGDTAYFETVNTDKNGIAKVSFKLPDNVTTYRVTAHAVNKDLYLGEATENIVSTLDFFIQYTEPRAVKTTDDLELVATSVVDEDYKVDFEFTIEELNKSLKTTAKTNEIAIVNFGKIPVGKYHTTIKGTYGTKKDVVKYEFEIVNTAQEVKEKTTFNISEVQEINPTKNPIKLEIYNKNLKQYMDYIDFIESTYSARLDTKIAYNEIQNIKSNYYGATFSKNDINIDGYYEDNRARNLKAGNDNLLLTALIKYYAGIGNGITYRDTDNLFEYYLNLAANNEPVLQDLKYLAEEKEIGIYGKLLVTLSFEFLGDYNSARTFSESYRSFMTKEEKEEYASIIAIIDTFINKSNAKDLINYIIEKRPADEYVRFAILSYFKNNSNELEEEQKVMVKSSAIKETITLNGLQVKTLTIYDTDLSTISFESESKDIMVSYYYQTSLENANNDNVSKDIKIKIDGDLNKNNVVNLTIDLSKLKNEEGTLRIALPNSLRLARDYYKDEESFYNKYYIENNRIEYVTFYKQKDCTQINIPLVVTLEGNYQFENVVFTTGDGIYHISNSLEF